MEKSFNDKISFALLTLRPKAQWILKGDDYAGLEWLDTEQTMPSWAEVEAEINNPTPQPEPTIEDKLASVGLTLPDLKAALGL
jgi:hypothetical protein